MRSVWVIILALTISFLIPAHLAFAYGGGGSGGGAGGGGASGAGEASGSIRRGDPTKAPAGIILSTAPPINAGQSDPTSDPLSVTSPEPGGESIVEAEPIESEGGGNDPFETWRNQPPSMGPLQGGGPPQPIQLPPAPFVLVPGIHAPPVEQGVKLTPQQEEELENLAWTLFIHAVDIGAAYGTAAMGPTGWVAESAWNLASSYLTGGSQTQQGAAAALGYLLRNMDPLKSELVEYIIDKGIGFGQSLGQSLGPVDPEKSPHVPLGGAF